MHILKKALFIRSVRISLLYFAVACALSGCLFLAKPAPQIPTELLPAPSGHADRLVIVLPGRGDDLAMLRKSGIADVIQQSLPNADVLLAEVTLAYYMQGRATQRMHSEIVEPAKQKNYREIYLAGASMGGMGVLMYEREYPNDMSGLILMAPYMGDAALTKEIKAAGGVTHWDPGPVPPELSRDLVPKEEWRVVKSWSASSPRSKNVWLICGRSDRLHEAAKLIAPELPTDHFIEVDGSHAWKVWTVGATRAFSQIAATTH